MYFLEYQRMVIAYHGCDQAVVDSVMRGTPLQESANDYDWLGKGTYFWEQGPARALSWAKFMKRRGRVSQPAVLGAVIQLGNTLDLLDVNMTTRLEKMFPVFESGMKSQKVPLPVNDPAKKMHRLDCAFLNWAIPFLENENNTVYHTVRGAFVEGPPLYAKAQIHRETHIQLAVRHPGAIIGYFLPAKS